jgi:SMI1/KNR4 family protein SUKH-1
MSTKPNNPTKINWPALIEHVLASRARVFDVDKGRFWGFSTPRPGARPSAIDAAERRLDGELDWQYREFLGHADGWPFVFQGLHLFGTGELGAGPIWDETVEVVGYAAESPELPDVATPARWLPIGLDAEANGFVVQQRRAGTNAVAWFSGGAVGERWPTFESFLLGLAEFNYLDALALETDPRMREALEQIPIPDPER